MTAHRPTECDRFETVIQRMLDGEFVPTTTDPHLGECVDCRELWRAASVLASTPWQRPVSVPAGFADGVLAVVAPSVPTGPNRTSWFRLRTVVSVVSSLAAGVMLAVTVGLPTTNRPQSVARSTPDLADPPPIGSLLRDTGNAFVSLTKRATGADHVPGRSLFTVASSSARPATPTRTSADILTTAKVGVEPLTSTTKRAINLFIRDVGRINPGPKSNL